MARVTKSLAYAAGLGLLASAAVHIVTFFGVNPMRAIPGVMLLHVLPIILLIAAAFMGYELSAKEDSWLLWDVLARRTPLWMKALCCVLFCYAIINFFYVGFGLNELGMPSTHLGPKALVDHGKIIRLLTDEEYEKHQAYVVRQFSGHWMFFCATAMTMLYVLGKERESRDVGSPEQEESST